MTTLATDWSQLARQRIDPISASALDANARIQAALSEGARVFTAQDLGKIELHFAKCGPDDNTYFVYNQSGDFHKMLEEAALGLQSNPNFA